MNQLQKFPAKNNVVEAENIFESLKWKRLRQAALKEYIRRRFGLITLGAGLCFVGAITLGIERVLLETTESASLSWLAYFYNLSIIVGAALVSSTAFHYYAKRNAETRRLDEIESQLEDIRVERLRMLRGAEGESDEN